MTTLTCIAPLDPAQPALGPLLDCATRDVTFARRTGAPRSPGCASHRASARHSTTCWRRDGQRRVDAGHADITFPPNGIAQGSP